MTNEERRTTFLLDLRDCVLEYNHGPNKHSRMINAINYTHKKIKVCKLAYRVCPNLGHNDF